MRAEEFTAEFGIAGTLDFVETEHGLVKAVISLDGITGELYLDGAQLTAWRPAGDRPVLFTSPKSLFAPGKAIRGGIPSIFPWFGPNRHAQAAPQHGFARTTPWHLDGGGDRGQRGADFDPQPLQNGGSIRSPSRRLCTATSRFPKAPPSVIAGLAGTRPYRQDRSGTAQAADREACHYRGGDRLRVPRYPSAVRH